MKPITPEPIPETKPVARRATTDSEFGPNERRVVRTLLWMGVALIALTLWQTVGRDALSFVRRLPIFRKVAPLPERGLATSGVSSGNTSSQVAASPLTGLPASSRSFEERSPVKADREPLANPTEPIAEAVVKPEPAEPAANQLNDKGRMPAEVPLPPNPVAGGVDAIPADLLGEAARLVSLGWQDFDYPAKWFAGETSKPRMLYNGHRNRVLNAIAIPRPSEQTLAQLRKDYATAREQFADDPRLDYAFGLALWHHGERSEAIDVFQTAARLEGTPFLPAALAVGWARLTNGEERQGLHQLNHVAKLLNSPEPYPTETQKEYAALCLGRAFGYLLGPGRRSDLSESVELTALNIRQRLPADLLDSFELGLAQVGQRESELLQFAALPENAIAIEHRRQSDDLQSRIDTLREEMLQTRQELSRGHVSHLAKVGGFLTDILKGQGTSSELQPMIQQIKQKIMQLNQPQGQVNVRSRNGELQPAGRGTSSTTGARTTGTTTTTTSSGSGRRNGQSGQTNTGRRQHIVVMPETASDRAARMAKLDAARTELQRIQDELTKLREQHKELLDQRHQADAERAALTQEARQLQADRLRERREVEKRLRELNTALRQLQGLRNSLDTVAAYVPWTIEVEGEAMRSALNRR